MTLSVRTLRLRRRLRIAVGDGGNTEMLRAMRAHANFNEYVPIALILLFFFESSGAKPLYIHLAGSAILLGRILHSFGISQLDEKFVFRVSGMALTLTTLILTSLYILTAKLFF